MKKSFILSLLLIIFSFSCTLLTNNSGSISFNFSNSQQERTLKDGSSTYSIQVTAAKGFFSKTINTSEKNIILNDLRPGEYEIIVTLDSGHSPYIDQGKTNVVVVAGKQTPAYMILEKVLQPIFVDNTVSVDIPQGTKDKPFTTIRQALDCLYTDEKNVTIFINGTFNENIKISQHSQLKRLSIEKAPDSGRAIPKIKTPNISGKIEPALVIDSPSTSVYIKDIDFIGTGIIEGGPGFNGSTDPYELITPAVIEVLQGSCKLLNSSIEITSNGYSISSIYVHNGANLTVGGSFNTPRNIQDSNISLDFSNPPIINVSEPLTSSFVGNIVIEKDSLNDLLNRKILYSLNSPLSDITDKFTISTGNADNAYYINSKGEIAKNIALQLQLNPFEDSTDAGKYSCKVDDLTSNKNITNFVINQNNSNVLDSTGYKTIYFKPGHTYEFEITETSGGKLKGIEQITIQETSSNISISLDRDYTLVGFNDTLEPRIFDSLADVFTNIITASNNHNVKKYELLVRFGGNPYKETKTNTIVSPLELNIKKDPISGGDNPIIKVTADIPLLSIENKDTFIKWDNVPITSEATTKDIINIKTGHFCISNTEMTSSSQIKSFNIGAQGILTIGDGFVTTLKIGIEDGAKIYPTFSTAPKTQYIIQLPANYDLSNQLFVSLDSNNKISETQINAFKILDNKGMLYKARSNGTIFKPVKLTYEVNIPGRRQWYITPVGSTTESFGGTINEKQGKIDYDFEDGESYHLNIKDESNKQILYTTTITVNSKESTVIKVTTLTK